MKTYIVYLVIGLVAINSLSAQVKIGDNPQNLNPASLLELQSSNRVLVITRVTDAQMSGISPLPGAVVYNTDQGCLHYYNGTEWINICEELDNSFTVSTRADSLQQVNPNARDNTIAILESINPDGSTNYNFEVNRITGANIVDTSINGSTKLQNESVTNNKLAEKSVGLRNLADATNTGDLLMYNGTAWNFVNRTDLLNTQLDSIVGNEVVGPTDATLLVNGAGSQADPLTLDVAEGGITAFEIATDAVTTDEILNGNILTEDISDDAVTTVKIIDGAVTNAKLDKANIPLSGFAAAAANVDLGSNRIINLADPVDALDAANKAYVDNEITNNAADGTETIVTGAGINVVTGDGSAGTPYVITATEAQNLADVIAIDPSAGNSPITDITDPTNPQDAATKNYVDNEITNNAADGTETIVTGAGINVVTGDGSAGTPYVITATEAQNLADVIAIDPSAGNSPITDITDPTNPQDAATKNYVDNEITNNAADGTETIVTGAGINVVTGDGSAGTPYVITATEAQNLADVVAIDPSAGNSVITDVTDPTNPQDAATKNYVDNEITNNAADGSETLINAGTDINITGDGTTGTPYVINSTFTEAQDLADVIAIDPSAGNSAITDVTDPTNPQDAATKNYVDNEITNNAADGSETLINAGTDINITGNGSTGTPYVINSTFTEAQDLADVIAIDPSAGNNAITDVTDPTNPQDAATKAYVDSVTDEIALTGQVASGTSTSTGEYTINNAAITTTSIIQLTVQENASGNPIIIQLTNQDTAEFSVKIFEFQPAPTLVDANWQYIVVNP